jgi:uncharacterized protein
MRSGPTYQGIMIRKPLQNILVKPAGPDCNMACSYCFYSCKQELFRSTAVHRMSEEVLTELIRQFMEQSGPEVSITWQGGEPTLMGLDFFRKAAALEERFGKRKTIGNGMQTNGLLIDKEWASFFKRYSFLVGLSIDGPEHIHDHYRRRHGGQPTWRTICDSAKLMLDSGVSVNALTVVNDYSARFPDDIYAFHKEIGLNYMQFIPCLEPDPVRAGCTAPFSVTPEAYGDFLCRIFDLWLNDFRDGRQTTSVRFFESLLFSYAGFPPAECTLSPECGSYVVVEHNGDVFACDFFVEENSRLGNIMHGSLDAMLNSEKQLAFGRMKSDLPPLCEGCTWLAVCRGGCPKDRLPCADSGRLNYLCRAFKRFFSHADSGFRHLVDEWRQSQALQNSAAAIHTANAGRNELCPCGSGKKYKRCCGKD